jgi:hypothetical protein
MKEIKIPFEKFKFDEFMEAMHQFSYEAEFYYEVPWIYKSGDEPNYDEKIERDYLHELKEEGKLLYFDFTTSNYDGIVECADGYEYEEGEDNFHNFGIGVEDTVGYLLGYKEGTLVINSAVNCGAAVGAASIRISSNCGFFDEPMEEFVRGFIQ